MPSYRIHPLTGEWILLAPERRTRPNAFAPMVAQPRSLPADCPFCPGNEEETPSPIVVSGETDHWTMRVVPNKYPAISPLNGAPNGNVATGVHEVIIESPDHDLQFESYSHEQRAAVFTMYVERFRVHAAVAEIAFLVLFRNEGLLAGQSMDHPHSQLLALTDVPPLVRARERSIGTPCPLCTIVSDHDDLTLIDSNSFVAAAPYASRFPYEIWVVPKEHSPDIRSLSDEEAAELAACVQSSVLALRRRLGAAVSYNWTFRMAPLHDATIDRAGFHWYLEITPRLAFLGGFELGAGMYVNIVDPADAAAELRKEIRP